MSRLSVTTSPNAAPGPMDSTIAADTATAKAVNQIRNSLVMANTAQAATLAALGPSMQNETKKQTGYLAKIAKNTEKTADNTEDSTNALDTW